MATKANTRARRGGTNLCILIANFTSANDAYGVAANREDKASSTLRRLAPVDHPKAVGGMSQGVTLVVDGKSQVIPASEFYYRSHEEIDAAMKEKAGKANNAAERRAVAADRKRLHAELRRDAARIADATVRSVPPAVMTEARLADVALTKASKVYATTRQAVLKYRPHSVHDAAILLEFIASRNRDMIDDTADAALVMRNVAKAIKR